MRDNSGLRRSSVGNPRQKLRVSISSGFVLQSSFMGILFASSNRSEALMSTSIMRTSQSRAMMSHFQSREVGVSSGFPFEARSTRGLNRGHHAKRVHSVSQHRHRRCTLYSMVGESGAGGEGEDSAMGSEPNNEEAGSESSGSLRGEQAVRYGEVLTETRAVEVEGCSSYEEERAVVAEAQQSLNTGVTEPAAEGKLRRQKLKGEALRDELMRREREEKKAVLEANTAYYRARAYKLIDDLKDTWDDSELSDCVRAGGLRMRGYFTIAKLHEVEFGLARKVEKRGQRPFKILNVNVEMCGSLAWVTCVEDMRHPLKPKPSTVQLVTNVFRKTSEGWKMVRHHASHKGPDTLSGQLTKTPPDSAGEVLPDSSIRASRIAEIRKRVFTPKPGSKQDGDEDKEGERAALERDESLKQRIRDAFARSGIMAQDVIINSADDVQRQDSFEREESAAEVASRIKQYLLKNKLITPEAAKAEDERIKAIKAKIAAEVGARIRSLGGVNGSSEDEGGKADREAEDGDLGSDESSLTASAASGDDGSSESRVVTRETVHALRELARVGKITETEKRLLLADVIRNTSGGRHSTVEVAFEFLVGESGKAFDPEESEEFTEQCKVHAAQLADQDRRSRRRWWKFWQWFRKFLGRR